LSDIVKIDTTGLKEKIANLHKAISEREMEPINATLGALASDVIYKRVKSGYGVTSDTDETPEKEKLEPLSKTYIAFREGYVRFFTKDGKVFVIGNTSKIGKARKATGPRQKKTFIEKVKRGVSGFVSSIREAFSKKPIKQHQKEVQEKPFPSPVTGEFGSPRRSNLTLTGQMLNAIKYSSDGKGFKLYIDNNSREKDNNTNAQIASYVRKKRPFFALTGGEQRILLKQFTDSLIRLLVNIK
jgi:hypothetical protein